MRMLRMTGSSFIGGGFVLAVAVLAAACGNGAMEPEFPERQPSPPDMSQAGSVAGVVRFAGEAPKARILPAPHAHCAREGHVIRDETYVVQDGKLANVLVYVKEGLEAYTFPYEKSEAEVDQRLCVFVPHVLAVQTYQPVRFRNSDIIQHNVNSTASSQGFSIGISPKEGSKVRQFKQPEMDISVTCDLHANMRMYVHVLEHPHFVVTGPDGAFSLELPPGDYVLAARHEKMGEKTMKVTVEPGGAATGLDFTFRK